MLSNGFAVIGETSKYTAVSPNRFAAIRPAPQSGQLALDVAGAAGESVSFVVLAPQSGVQWKVKVIVANFTERETRTIHVGAE